MAEHEGPWSSLPPPPSPPPRPGPGFDRRLAIFVAVVAAGAVLIFALTRLYPAQADGAAWGAPAMNLGFIALVASSLFSRRLGLGQVARYIGLWAVVIAVLAVGYVYRDDIAGVGLRIRSALDPSHAVQTAPNTVVLTESANGEYDVMGDVNGQPVRFVVDTGSSDIVLSPADAARVGAPAGALKFDRHYESPGGRGLAADWQVSSLAVGSIRFSGVPVSVNQIPMGQSLLGMSFLHRLDSYEFKGRQLILHGPAAH